MALTVRRQSLSALKPISLRYSANDTEILVSTDNVPFENNLVLNVQPFLSGYKDAAISRENCFVLTDVLPLSNVFASDTNNPEDFYNFSIYVLTQDGLYLKDFKNGLFVDGEGSKTQFNFVFLAPRVCYIKSNPTTFLEVEQNYPYNVFLTDLPLDDDNKQYRTFEVKFLEDVLMIKTAVPEGYRYLSYGPDQRIRAIGLELNDIVVNPYAFKYENVQSERLINKSEGTEYATVEIKYDYDLKSPTDLQELTIQSQTQNNTNLLMSCTVKELAEEDVAKINIALLKNNFSNVGSYSTR